MTPLTASVAATTRPPAGYHDLEALPDNVVGEILDGELHMQPRPAGPHSLAGSGVMIDIGTPFQRGNGGPGGWWILIEPELHLGRHILVPDLAGWRRERMPSVPLGHRFTVAPDWVCEILSPSTARKDRILKMRIYAQQGVAHCWLLDPLIRTLEAYSLMPDGHWQLNGTYGDAERVRAAPFDAVELDMTPWWTPGIGEEPEEPAASDG